MGCFIGGLKKEIAIDVKMFWPQLVCEAALGLVRMKEEKVARSWKMPQPFLSRSLPNSKVTSTTLSTAVFVKNLNAAQMQASVVTRGCCYNYDEKFFVGHKCRTQQLYLL